MDGERVRQPVSILRDFVGQYSDVQPDAIPNGGMETQINCFSKKTGQLETRGGLVEISLTVIDE